MTLDPDAPQPLMLSEDEAIELLAFLVTSARIQVDEPAHYGCIRLLTAAERLSDFIIDRASPQARPVLETTRREVPQMHGRLSDLEDYVTRLDALCRAVAEHLVERNGLAEGAS